MMNSIGMIDYCIFDFLGNLRKIITMHRHYVSESGEAAPYYPHEIIEYISYKKLFDMWEDQRYEDILTYCGEAYVEYISDVLGEEPHFTFEQFLNGEAADVLKDFS